MNEASFELAPFPRERHDIIDALEVGMRRHMVHALLEFDVTRALQLIRAQHESEGYKLSFTAFLVASVARAIDGDKRLHAYRDWRGRLVLFDEVDVVTLIESEVDSIAIPHVVRAANRRALREIHDEIRRIQSKPAASEQRSGLLIKLSRLTPSPLRRLFFRALRRDPQRLKRVAGTTLVTSVGMFGLGAGWALGIVPLHTLCLTVGGITRKPGVVDGGIEPRDYLALTASIDHDIVDGAPAARFAKRLREIVEGAEVLAPSPEPGASPEPSRTSSGISPV
ncbi:MAG: 2-oxo acid dehydrogenase subunit E2 [Myxococcales bacterium]|nr:2-oxo acid dehydrogenase subunit E2 [Myxococcales bacterium]